MGAVLLTQTNALGHKLTREIDARGRVKSIADDNGLKISLSHDAFNRVTKKTLTGSDGKDRPDKTVEYARSSTPYYDTVTYYDEDAAPERVFVAVQGGFGDPLQIWQQGADGHYLATTEIHDLRGLATGDSHPQDMGSSFAIPATPLSISDALSKTYYDALGTARENVRDAAKSTGALTVYFDSPREELRQDEAGYQTKLTYDALNRVKKVEQGKSGTFTTMARYRYDPLGRLVKFTDGGGVYYTYSYDGAGRLRKVSHGKTGVSVPAATWYTHEYKGGLRTKTTDAAGLALAQEYDAAGRVTKITASDGLPGATGDLLYEMDYDDTWVGALYKTTDPAGETILSYDEFGRVRLATRKYVAIDVFVSGKLAQFVYLTDLRGNVTAQTFPTSRTVRSDYDYGYRVKTTASVPGKTDHEIAYGYNKWGLQKSATSSLGHKFTAVFTTPLWLDKTAFTYGDNEYVRKYKWYDNGLLQRREEYSSAASSGFASTLGDSASALPSGGLDDTSAKSIADASYSYAYDNLKQLASITSATTPVEKYAFDSAGNPTKVRDAAGATWLYAAAGTLNQIARLTSEKGGFVGQSWPTIRFF